MATPVNPLLGELMLGAEILTEEELLEAQQIGKASGMPLERVLIVSGYITSSQLQKALGVQALLRRGEICTEEACDTIRQS